MEFINNENVVIINVLGDSNEHPYTCEDWGVEGLPGMPIIIDDLDESQGSYIIANWFGIIEDPPKHLFIDHNFNYYAKMENHNNAKEIIEEMLENLNEE